MAGQFRILWFALAFIALVGLFVFMQRDPAPESDVLEGAALEGEPIIREFETQAGTPRLVAPAGEQPAVGNATEPVAASAGQATSPERRDFETQQGTPQLVSPGTPVPMPAASAGQGSSQGLAGAPAPSAGLGGAGGSGSAVPPASTGPGPAPGGIPLPGPEAEMISLPASGPGPGATSVGMQSLPPEHGSVEGALAPEAGASGPMEAPELLPVTHPGPAGESPTGSQPTGPGPGEE